MIVEKDILWKKSLYKSINISFKDYLISFRQKVKYKKSKFII